MWREACTITTVEQLDALPVGSITTDSDVIGGNYERVATEDGEEWWTDGMNDPNHDARDLPTLLIWHPDWSRA